MKTRLLYAASTALLAVLVTLVVWQSSFTFGGSTSPFQTLLLWAVSLLIFILSVTLGFMLLRTAVRLYIERHSNREGSRLKTKLVLGALALSVTPVVFFVGFTYSVLNYNLARWFHNPTQQVGRNLADISRAMDRETQEEVLAQARWFSLMHATHEALAAGSAPPGSFDKICAENDIVSAEIVRDSGPPVTLCQLAVAESDQLATASLRLPTADGIAARLVLRGRMAIDLAARQREINRSLNDYDQLVANFKAVRRNYLLLLTLVTLFTLFLAVWVALFLSRLISGPISALLGAAEQVRAGNLTYRVRVDAIDELANLVRSFNDMTQDLETSRRELERRQRFTEAILESIPTGVVSFSADGRIQKVNRALSGIFTPEQALSATRLEDLFSSDDVAEIRYLMNRARRTRVAATQLELRNEHRVMHVSLVVAALEDRLNSGFVLVIEDTSELLRAQRTAAWQEVARRVAHEIKNPLTPIALSAERISRQLQKHPLTHEVVRILHECSSTITQEVESVRELVDEFSQFSRFPTAHPVAADLNEVIETALSAFQGRLDGIEIRKSLAPMLPAVCIDREQFKRVIVNLIANAAEAMEGALLQRLYIATGAPTPDTVELVIADTGSGISPDDKEKLFLPYFSTKQRGTGLGLAIVHHILVEHNAVIRVEDNRPTGARFLIELPALVAVEAETR